MRRGGILLGVITPITGNNKGNMPHKILIVDNDESIRFVLKEAHAKEGYEVSED